MISILLSNHALTIHAFARNQGHKGPCLLLNRSKYKSTDEHVHTHLYAETSIEISLKFLLHFTYL